MSKKAQREAEHERRLREADKQATVAMLAANLSHHLGTPLNVIRGRVEHLLRQEENPPNTVAALKTIVGQVDKIAAALRLLLDLSAQRELTRSLHDVREIVRSSVHPIEARADASRVAVSLELGDAPLLVRCDPDQLEQLFINVIETALETMADQGGPLRIFAETGFSAEPQLRIIIENCGCVLAPEAIQRLFDPFLACGEHRTVGDMGLAVAQSIAREHDGEIAFEKGAHGCRFLVNLPLLASAGRSAE